MKTLLNRVKAAWNGETGKNPLFWGVLLFAMLLKYSYYGLTYFPTLDDHNMYGIYSLIPHMEALLGYDMYTTRPLAVLLDIFVISGFWGNLWFILLAFTLLHFISSILIYKVFEKNNVRTGTVLAVTFTLLPLGNDATYWIAASSRIVTGLFFAVLSFFLYMRYIDKCNVQEKCGRQEIFDGQEIFDKQEKYNAQEKCNKKEPQLYLYIAGFAVANLISLGFYEQVIAFSFVGILLLMAVNFKGQKNKWICAIPFINIAIIGSYYLMFSSAGNMASRGLLLRGKYFSHTINVFKKIRELMTVVPGSQIKHGIINGIALLISDRAVVFALLAILVSVALGIFYAREKTADSRKTTAVKFLLGLFLIILPFAPFFALETLWIVFRNAFISIIGIGLVAESLVETLFSRWSLKVFRGIAAGVAVFILLIGNVAEVNDYRNVSLIDHEIAMNLSEALEEARGQDWSKYEVIVFNTRALYIVPTSKHFSNITAVDWALTGAMRSILRRPEKLNFLHPAVAGQKASISRDQLDRCILIGMDSTRSAFPLQGSWTSNNEFELRLDSDELFGTVNVLGDDIIIFELKK
jgi:hypothetical protein